MATMRQVSRAVVFAAFAVPALAWAVERPAPPQARAAVRRLTRREHEHVLRDLLDLPGLAVRDLMPEDGRAHGFDRCADALDVSPVHVAAWREAAAEAIRLATVSGPAAPQPAVERLLPGAQELFQLALLEGDAVFLRGGRYDSAALPLVSGSLAHSLAHYEGTGLFPYRHSVGVFRRQGPDDHFALFFNRFTARRTGRHRLRLSVWSFHWDRGTVGPAAAPEAVTLHANDRLLGTFDAPSLEPQTHTIDAWLNAGERILFTAATIPPERVWQRPGRAAEYVGPGVAIDHLEVEGPLVESWPPPGHRLLHGDGPRPDPRRVLPAFLTRAFRRPATTAEVARFTALVNRRTRAGDTPDAALRAAAEAALCSAEFLFLGGPAGPLDDWHLAARLASFLWDSMPDDQLFALARSGRLRDPGVLRAQVDRLLDDPKSGRFVEHFTDEWLDLREIDATTPDAALYPEFSPHLRDSMLAETRAFVAELLARDEPATALVAADFAMVNQRLAEHYGLAAPSGPVRGAAIRRVSLPADSPRGGLLGQASVLKVTANGTVTSPVKRGAWVLREILANPPEPPPAGVPTFDPDVRGATTIREQLARHTADASCAACHASIDPPGFALESFDVIGGWRDRARVPRAARAEEPVEGLPVDASGTLPDGRRFASFAEFRRILAADRLALARAFARQLVVYATGADVTDADRAELDAIVDRAAARNHGLRTLVHEVVASRLFLEQ